MKDFKSKVNYLSELRSLLAAFQMTICVIWWLLRNRWNLDQQTKKLWLTDKKN